MDPAMLIESWLTTLNLGTATSGVLARILLAAAVLLLSLLTFVVSRKVVKEGVHRLIRHTRFTWDDRLLENRLLLRVTLLVPVLIVTLFLPWVFNGMPRTLAVATGVLHVGFIFVGVLVADALINALHDIYCGFRVSREIPLKGFVQVCKIVLYGTALILIVAVVLNRSPVYLLSGLGALTAVFMLVFKDPILGFAAGIQLISNRMLKNGDWIEMSRYGADGDVEDITLTTVKVRNWDNTITTIPTYALINDSFKNWRGMQESGGRRIKRALHVDMSSISPFVRPTWWSASPPSTVSPEYMATKQRGADGSQCVR
jgi:miniconductance mechanosensitive channel